MKEKGKETKRRKKRQIEMKEKGKDKKDEEKK